MPCTRPRTASQKAPGAPLNWSKKKYNSKDRVFQLPCGKCIECRLAYGRSWAIRAIHEASQYENNIFLTLTYDDDHIGNNKLNYKDFQNFMERLRYRCPEKPISYIVCGEYGKQTKRMHWHAILFNFTPIDGTLARTTERKDKVYSSKVVTEIWGHGLTEYGGVTIESAGYVARYSAKKLVHGKDDHHDFQPIFKVSSKYAIGKKWLEKYWRDVFSYGYVDYQGQKLPIPRYYQKWFEKHEPTHWQHYVTTAKAANIKKSEMRAAQAKKEWTDHINNREKICHETWPKTELQRLEIIQKQKFEELQKRQKF